MVSRTSRAGSTAQKAAERTIGRKRLPPRMVSEPILSTSSTDSGRDPFGFLTPDASRGICSRRASTLARTAPTKSSSKRVSLMKSILAAGQRGAASLGVCHPGGKGSSGCAGRTCVSELAQALVWIGSEPNPVQILDRALHPAPCGAGSHHRGRASLIIPIAYAHPPGSESHPDPPNPGKVVDRALLAVLVGEEGTRPPPRARRLPPPWVSFARNSDGARHPHGSESHPVATGVGP